MVPKICELVQTFLGLFALIMKTSAIFQLLILFSPSVPVLVDTIPIGQTVLTHPVWYAFSCCCMSRRFFLFVFVVLLLPLFATTESTRQTLPFQQRLCSCWSVKVNGKILIILTFGKRVCDQHSSIIKCVFMTINKIENGLQGMF